jgi:hypothetical protein
VKGLQAAARQAIDRVAETSNPNPPQIGAHV